MADRPTVLMDCGSVDDLLSSPLICPPIFKQKAHTEVWSESLTTCLQEPTLHCLSIDRGSNSFQAPAGINTTEKDDGSYKSIQVISALMPLNLIGCCCRSQPD